MNAKLSIVATPIGNLEDITLRALEILRQADLILCEDTRVTKKLLMRHSIDKPTLSYHAHSKISRTDGIIQNLKESKKIVLVSDAGTPGISDPGSELVRRIRLELAEEIALGSIKIEAIPGPSALTAALSVAGVPCADFLFLGFLPHKKGRETLFAEISASKRSVVFYESPHRIIKTLASLVEHLGKGISTSGRQEKLGDMERSLSVERQENNEEGRKNVLNVLKKVTVCRELTKIFEEVVHGSPTEVMKYFENNPDKVRGEFVVIVSEE